MILPLVYVLGAVGMTTSFNQRMLDPLTALIARDTGFDISMIVMLSPAFTLPYALSQPFLGPLADSIGKARVLRICLITIAVVTALSYFATDYWLLFSMRVVTGLAAGGIIPVALALIADRTPVEQRQIALSRFMLAIIIGQLYASPLSAFIAKTWHWQVVFFLGAAMAAIGVVILFRRVKPNPDAERRPFSLSTAMATYRRILASPIARACYVGVFAEGLFIFGFTPHIAPYLEEHRFGGAIEAGYVLASMGLGGLIYGIVVPRLVKRFSIYTLMKAGGVMLGTGFLGIALASGWPWIAVAYGVIGFGFYMLHSGLQTCVTEVLPDQRASVVSLHAFFMFFGIAAGPIFFDLITGRAGSTAALMVSSIAIVVASVAATSFLQRKSRDDGAG